MSTASLGVWGKCCDGLLGVVVMCLAHCWVLEQQRLVRCALGCVELRRVCFWFPAHGLFRLGCGTHVCVCCSWLVFWCVVGLLFENYIVNASIFIKKQFL